MIIGGVFRDDGRTVDIDRRRGIWCLKYGEAILEGLALGSQSVADLRELVERLNSAPTDAIPLPSREAIAFLSFSESPAVSTRSWTSTDRLGSTGSCGVHHKSRVGHRLMLFFSERMSPPVGVNDILRNRVDPHRKRSPPKWYFARLRIACKITSDAISSQSSAVTSSRQARLLVRPLVRENVSVM